VQLDSLNGGNEVAKHRVGIVGAGARGETFARQLYAGTRRAELFGVCDLDADRLGKFCDYCGLKDAPRYTDTRAFLTEKGLDAVIITVPEFAHKDVAVAAMKAGKHVYIEKPLAHTLPACREIVEVNRATGTVAYVGFNMRANVASRKLKEIVGSGVLGQIVHISGLEQLAKEHGASFMRRFHRKSENSGGLLNHKCSHDIDVMLWLIGHEHKVARVASFGGTNVFTPDKQPARRCIECPPQTYDACPYRFQAGFVFPVGSKDPILHRDVDIYGGDLCAYSADKDLVDNQAVIMEFDNGVRGDFRLQMFQAQHRRQIIVWGEKGFVEMDSSRTPNLRLVNSSGDTTSYEFGPRTGGHGGTDQSMIEHFVDAIEGGETDSGLSAGLAASLLALKADEARLTGRVVEISPKEYL
jgi:predicted dehydrogenase